MHAAKRRYSTNIKYAKTFLKAFPRKFLSYDCMYKCETSQFYVGKRSDAQKSIAIASKEQVEFNRVSG